MRVAVLSDTRVATLPVGGHGLGRLAFDIAHHMSKRGQAVTLFAGPGSMAPDRVALTTDDDELKRAEFLRDDPAAVTHYDIFIDLSHHHDLSKFRPALPVINWVVDGEASYQPPNCVVGNEWQRKQYPSAKLVPLGIEVDAIPYHGALSNGGYLLFAGKIIWHKGYDLAIEVAQRTGIPLKMAGENLEGIKIPDSVEYVGQIADNTQFYDLLGQALCVLAPSRYDAGGRGVLEAQATGTPVLCLDGTGTKYHVAHGISGYWCRDAAEMAEAVGAVERLDRGAVRDWVKQTHDVSVMIDGLLTLADALVRGEAW